MIYLSGSVHQALGGRGDTGYMLTPAMGNRPDLSRTPWAADTGCYTRPDAFDLDGYVRWLGDRLRSGADTCLFATAPDRVADPLATLRLSLPVLPLIRELGAPAAFVLQDGARSADIPWDEFDVLFVGGSTEYKLSEPAYELVAEAKARGKGTHMGRVNSLRRLRAAALSGYDSADGTFIAFGGDHNVRRMERWLAALRLQPALPVEVT